MYYFATKFCLDKVLDYIRNEKTFKNENQEDMKSYEENLSFLIVLMAIMLLCFCPSMAQDKPSAVVLKAIQKVGLVWVDGGTFSMGSSDTEAYQWEKPVHNVTVSGFYIGKYEVTQKLWSSVMKRNPSENKGLALPVNHASWIDCCRFCNVLSLRCGLKCCYRITGRGMEATVELVSATGGFRLPTEAEWEFAARGGNKSKGYKYSGSNSVSDVAWQSDNSDFRPHAVGHKKANELGLFDMSGNVWEWCWDLRADYTSAVLTNPLGADSGNWRIVRGGSFDNDATVARCSYRHGFADSYTEEGTGLRLVLVP